MATSCLPQTAWHKPCGSYTLKINIIHQNNCIKYILTVYKFKRGCFPSYAVIPSYQLTTRVKSIPYGTRLTQLCKELVVEHKVDLNIIINYHDISAAMLMVWILDVTSSTPCKHMHMTTFNYKYKQSTFFRLDVIWHHPSIQIVTNSNINHKGYRNSAKAVNCV